MNKNAVILFTSTPRNDAKRKSNSVRGEIQLRNMIAKSISIITKTLSCEQFDLLVFSDGDLNQISDSAVYQQKGNSFAEKLTGSIERTINLGYEKIAVIGNDTFGISKNFVSNSFNTLKENEVIVGPSNDGGFYFLAFNSKEFTTNFKSLLLDLCYHTGKELKQLINGLKNLHFQIIKSKKKKDADTFEEYKREFNYFCLCIKFYENIFLTIYLSLSNKFTSVKNVITNRLSYQTIFLKAPPEFSLR